MAESNQVSLIWNRAIDQYQAITKKKLDGSTLNSVTTVDDLVQVIDEENNGFSDFRAKRHDLLTVLKYAMIPVELVGKVLASGAGQAFWPCALVFSGVELLLKAAKGVSSKYDAIIELMSSLKDFTNRLEIYAKYEMSQHLGQKLSEILASLIEVIAFARQEIKHGRLLSFGKSILSGSDAGSAAMAKFIKLVQSETALVGAETITQAKETSSTLSRMDQNVIKISQQLENLEVRKSTKASAASVIKQMLQPSSSAEDRLNSMNRSRIPDTGEWIKHKKEFVSWINRTTPVLWISGNPGAGKSYIACSIVNYLKHSLEKIGPSDVTSVGFFFFKDDNPKTRSVHQALRDIAFQIGQKNSVYAKYLESCIDASDDAPSLPLSTLWQRLFIDFFNISKNKDQILYIMLDALDEAFTEDRLEFFELAKDVSATGQIHLLMLGRPQIAEEMSELIELLAIRTIHVSEVNNLQDIVKYITTRVSRSMYLRRLPVDFKDEITEKLSAGSQGMFLWVELMFQELLRSRSVSSIQKSLQEAPKGLSSMVRHVLRGISESLENDTQFASDLNELLAWILCAYRPLTLGEVSRILKWRSPNGKGWIWLEGSLRIQFASIFSVNRWGGKNTVDSLGIFSKESNDSGSTIMEGSSGDEEKRSWEVFDSDPRTTTVTFNHAYWGEFFKGSDSRVSARDGLPSIGVEYHEAQVLVLSRCLGFICDEGFAGGEFLTTLQAYAFRSLIFHLEAVNIKKTSTEEKQFIGINLARVVLGETVFDKFYLNSLPSLGARFFSKETVDLLIGWLFDPDIHGNLLDESRILLDEFIATNRANILLLIAQRLAKAWLSNRNVSLRYILASSVYDFVILQDQRESSRLTSHEQIIEAAGWADYPKDAVWYESIGETLESHGLDEAAIQYLQKSLELDPSSKKAHNNLARIYFTIKDFKRFIDSDSRAAEHLEAQEPSSENLQGLHSIYERLAQMYLECEDWIDCIRTAGKGHAIANQCIHCADCLLEAYNRAGRQVDGFKFIERLNSISNGVDGTVFIDLLTFQPSTYHMLRLGFAAAILDTNRPPFLIHAYTQAISISQTRRRAGLTASLQLCLAYIYQVYAHDPSHAEQLYSQLVRDYGNSEAKGVTSPHVEEALHALSAHYLSAFLRSSRTEADILYYSKILEDLTRGRLPGEECDRIRSSEALPHANLRTELILAQFYEICGCKTEAAGMLKDKLRSCLKTFDDNVRSIDMKIPYSRLRWVAEILSALGDNLYSAGAFYKYWESPASHICDGCGSFCAVDGISICSSCPNLSFCEACLPLLKAGNLPVNVCHKDHNLIFIPPRPDDVKSRCQEKWSMLYIGGEWLTVEDFKSRLELKYEL